MRKDQRLRKTTDFSTARREGRSWSNRLLVLIARPNGLEVSRIGFSVGKRVGGAVVRNRVKRRVKEATRLAQIQSGWDLVLIARKDASSADFSNIQSSVNDLLGRSGVSSAGNSSTCLPSFKAI